MRILNEKNRKALNWVCLYLTTVEAKQLISYLQQLIDNPALHHAHLDDINYESSMVEREFTVTVYTDDNIHEFDERSRKLILEGK